jgi:hypothetical protein
MMPPTHCCSYCQQIAIGCDLDGEAGSTFAWAYVIGAAESGCTFFQHRLRQFRAADHDQGCVGTELSLKLGFYEPNMDDGEPGTDASSLECSWACLCGAMPLDENGEPDQDLTAFATTTNLPVRAPARIKYTRGTDKCYSTRKPRFDGL